MPRRVRQSQRVDPRGEERQEAFLAAATEVFLSMGFDKATLDDVIARSGGSRATLYARFGSKEGLFAAIIEAKCAQIVAALEPRRMDGDLEEALKDFAVVYMRELMSEESLALFRLVMSESTRFPKLGAAVFSAGPDAAARRLAVYLSGKAEAGALQVSKGGLDLAARQFLEMVKGDLHVRALMRASPVPTRREIAACIELAVKIFLDGVRDRPPGKH